MKFHYDYPQCCVFPQISQKLMQGTITSIDHCGKFFFQPHEGEPNVLFGIQNLLQKEKLTLAVPYKGILVFVYHKEKFHRAKIIDIGKETKVECYFFDYGWKEKVEPGCIFEVTQKLFDDYFFFPERGFHCKLSEIEPSFVKCPRGKWTEASIDLFRKHVKSCSCEIEIYSMVNNIASVEVKVNGININDTLVKEGYAVRCKECYVSRLDHEEREAYQLSDSSQWIDRKTEFKDRENSMVSYTVAPPPEELCCQSIYLNGPYSPLETKITGAMINALGSTKIEQTSVNSVQLNSCAENYDGQLLVASDVNANPSNGNTLYGVTALPNINGLPVLLTMIFAPEVIFECDDKYERIISIRSSLNFDCNLDSRFSVHECSLPVHFKLNTEDFNDINELRFNMSYLMNTNITEPKNETFFKINALIMKILQHERETLKPPSEKLRKVFASGHRLIKKIKSHDFIYNQIEFPKLTLD